MAEVRDLGALAAAAKPDRLVLAWIDKPLPVPQNMSGTIEVLPSSEARGLAGRWLGEGFGLPAALMIANQQSTCPPWRASLKPRDIITLRKICDDSARGTTLR
jgi:hypothetical protein